jgi:hypothetical protein
MRLLCKSSKINVTILKQYFFFYRALIFKFIKPLHAIWAHRLVCYVLYLWHYMFLLHYVVHNNHPYSGVYTYEIKKKFHIIQKSTMHIRLVVSFTFALHFNQRNTWQKAMCMSRCLAILTGMPGMCMSRCLVIFTGMPGMCISRCLAV